MRLVVATCTVDYTGRLSACAGRSTGSSSSPGTPSRVDLDGRLHPVRGLFAAQQIKPQAQVLATARGIECVEVDYDELRGAGTGA